MLSTDLLRFHPAENTWAPGMSSAEYHARPHISCHKLLDFEQSPKRFRAKYILNTNKDRRSAAMEFGTLFHERVLEPHLFDKRDVGPERAKNTKAWREFKINSPDGVHFKDKQFANQMFESVMEHGIARELLTHKQGRPELTGFFGFRDLPMRMRADYVTDDYILDLKTAESADDKSFGYSADKYGYIFQACLYTCAAELIDGKRRKFYFVVCEKVSPFEVAVYEVPDAAIEKEMSRLVTVADQLRATLESDKWGFKNEGIKPLWLTNYYFERLYDQTAD